MKKWKRILSAALSVLLLSGNISVYAAENLSAARTYTDRSEVIGTAVVVGDEESAGGSALFSRPGTIATITPGKPHSYGSSNILNPVYACSTAASRLVISKSPLI